MLLFFNLFSNVLIFDVSVYFAASVKHFVTLILEKGSINKSLDKKELNSTSDDSRCLLDKMYQCIHSEWDFCLC